jgi:hypothetical protein
MAVQPLPTLSQQPTQETTIPGAVAGTRLTEEYVRQIAQNTKLRELCRCVSEEVDSGRMKLLLDELYRALDERELLTSLL